MKAKIGINGLGRIGRMVLRSIFEENHKNLKIIHIITLILQDVKKIRALFYSFAFFFTLMPQ